MADDEGEEDPNDFSWRERRWHEGGPGIVHPPGYVRVSPLGSVVRGGGSFLTVEHSGVQKYLLRSSRRASDSWHAYGSFRPVLPS